MEQRIVYKMKEEDVDNMIKKALQGSIRELLYTPLNSREITSNIVAGLIGRNVDTVHRYGEDGVIPSHQPAGKGGVRLFKVGDVIQYMLEGECHD